MLVLSIICYSTYQTIGNSSNISLINTCLNKSSKILSRIKYNHSRITVSCLLMFTFGAKRNCWYCIFYIFLEAPWSLYYVFSARKVVLCLYNILMVPFSHYQFAQTNSMSYFSLLVSKYGLFDMPVLLIKKYGWYQQNLKWFGKLQI